MRSDHSQRATGLIGHISGMAAFAYHQPRIHTSRNCDAAAEQVNKEICLSESLGKHLGADF